MFVLDHQHGCLDVTVCCACDVRSSGGFVGTETVEEKLNFILLIMLI